MEPLTRLVPVEIPGYGQIMVEAIIPEGERDVVEIEKALSLDEVDKALQGIAMILKKTMDIVLPDKASVEFGLALAIEAGHLTTLLVKGSTSASLKIILTWGK